MINDDDNNANRDDSDDSHNVDAAMVLAAIALAIMFILAVGFFSLGMILGTD
jgi:hypothetical protein